MKKIIFIFLLAAGCQKASNQTWENIKTAGCYFTKSVTSLLGQDSEETSLENSLVGPKDDYVPLNEKDLASVPQSKLTPGKNNIPHLSQFKKPNRLIFQNIRFDTDDHVVRNQDDLLTLKKIANFIKKHPNIFLSIEGHCDERASAGYNMALGARRANHVRVLLIKQGVDYNRLYPVSFGKEKPLAKGHLEKDWAINRRVEFKIHER